MSLPSKYAPDGLSLSDQKRTITVGRPRAETPVNYIIKTIENRIDDAVNNQTYMNPNYDNEDIEMVPMDDYNEVNVISEFVNDSRSSGNFMYDDSMDIVTDESYNDTQVIGGNISYLVIDTNFILSHLNILDELKKVGNRFCLKIVIPITLMRELDGLKKSTKSTTEETDNQLSGKSVGHLARWANDWIYSALATNNSVVQGQKLRQRIDKDSTQDDAILDCCLYFKQNYPNSLVVLLSNDKNFCLKALTNGILTVSYRKDMNAELIAKTIYSENLQRFGKIEQKSIGQNVPLTHKTNIQSSDYSPINHENQQSCFDNDSLKVFSEVQTITLSAINHCMESTYGEDLSLLKDYDKHLILSLKDCTEVLIRFWFPVFQSYFDAERFKPFKEIGTGKKSIKRPVNVDIPQTPDELQQFVLFWSKILTTLYQAEMNARQNDALELLIDRWNKMVNSYI